MRDGGQKREAMDESSGHQERVVSVRESDEGPPDHHEHARDEDHFPSADRSGKIPGEDGSDHLADVDDASCNKHHDILRLFAHILTKMTAFRFVISYTIV